MTTYTISTEYASTMMKLSRIAELLEHSDPNGCGEVFAESLWFWLKLLKERNIGIGEFDDTWPKFLLVVCTNVRNYLLSEGVTLESESSEDDAEEG